jgi:CRP-like cAMP-binding protein
MSERKGRRQTVGPKDRRLMSDAVQNSFWTNLPGAVRERLIQHAKRVHLDVGETVFEAHHRPHAVYFPETAVVSRIAHLRDGHALQVGLIGNDGMTGISVLPGVAMAYDGIVQIAGTAVQVDAVRMADELRHPGSTHELLGKYAWVVLGDSIQTAACNNFHRVQQRCARWLLMMCDVMGRSDFPITQDLLAQMLGVRRATVTRAAQALHRAGIIDYKHGQLTVRNRRALETASCECYRRMRESRHDLLGS